MMPKAMINQYLRDGRMQVVHSDGEEGVFLLDLVLVLHGVVGLWQAGVEFIWRWLWDIECFICNKAYISPLNK